MLDDNIGKYLLIVNKNYWCYALKQLRRWIPINKIQFSKMPFYRAAVRQTEFEIILSLPQIQRCDSDDVFQYTSQEMTTCSPASLSIELFDHFALSTSYAF